MLSDKGMGGDLALCYRSLNPCSAPGRPLGNFTWTTFFFFLWKPCPRLVSGMAKSDCWNWWRRECFVTKQLPVSHYSSHTVTKSGRKTTTCPLHLADKLEIHVLC